MNHPEKQYETNNSFYKDQLQDQLINHALILCATLGTINLSISIIRDLTIGWIFRDSLFFIILFSIILVAFYRNKLKSHTKANIIILACLLCAAVGIHNFGMLAGAIFFLPLSSIIFALIYSKQAVIFFGVFLIAFLCFFGAGFSSGYIHLRTEPSSDFMMTNYFHWLVYSLTFGLFYLIACMTILKYRKLHIELLMNNKLQHDELAASNKELQKAYNEIRTLRGILPLCSFCKKIRTDVGNWEQVDVYIHEHSEADISHSICPDCMQQHYPEEYEEISTEARKDVGNQHRSPETKVPNKANSTDAKNRAAD